MDRRRFLTMIGATGAAAVASGCRSGSEERLISYLIPIEDISPGVSVEYATLCRECPAGCGMIARVRDGRAYKVEGNPEHPTGRGGLCLRGQTALQNLYNPDRIRGPLARDAFGRLQPIGWEEAQRAFLAVVRAARAAPVAWIGSLGTGPLDELVDRWLGALLPNHTRIRYEPFAYEALRAAQQRFFALPAVPDLRIEAAHMLLSFGAEFLETWVNNVEYARAFAAWRARRLQPGFAGRYVFVGPRLSLTGANADEWLPVRPGAEVYVARALVAVLAGGPAAAEIGALAEAAGVSADTIERLAREFAAHAPSLALPMGTAENGDEAVAANEAILQLNQVVGNVGRTYFPDRAHALSETARTAELLDLIDRLHAGEVSVLFLHHANPLYHLPPASRFAEALGKAPNIISFSSYLDETTARATLVLPDHTPYESWGSYTPRPGVTGLLQPLVPPVFDTRQTSDLLLASAAQMGHSLGPADSREYLRQGLGLDDAAWRAALQRGGIFDEGATNDQRPTTNQTARGSSFVVRRSAFGLRPSAEHRAPSTEHASAASLSLVLAPSVRFFDGRTANRPLTHEIPDPMAKVVWGSWAEIHPSAAERLGAQRGDLLRLITEHGEIQVPAYVTARVHPDAIALELGQGHTSYTRYGTDVGVNPLALLGALPAQLSGGVLASGVPVTVSRLPARRPIVVLQASREQPGEPIARQISLAEYQALSAEGRPIPSDEEKRPSLYRFHPPGEQQWGMTIDLDRCTGCNACVAACYVENNVPTVGRAECARGREMAWLRIENYEPPAEAALGKGTIALSPSTEHRAPSAVFLPMLCQHCDNAPCEYVCPVYATLHSNDGLNQQVYSRCIGTRYCSNNCPYKVRRFNWATHEFPHPLDQALNPDVVHRTKGVMEKCTFCVQRIRAGRIAARAQGRPIRDGEIQTACAQSCPTGAILFGNLKDPQSRVRAAGADPRGYGALAELNTYPNITYLARVHAEE